MSNLEPRILVGDKDNRRFERLKYILQQNFRTREVRQERTFEDLERSVRRSTWGIVLLADDLPEMGDGDVANLAGCVNRLRGIFQGPIVVIVSSEEDPEPIDSVTIHIHLSSTGSAKRNNRAEGKVITQLKVLGKRLPEYPRIPPAKLPDDPPLREQLRSLTEGRNLSEGLRVLGSIVREFFECDSFGVAKLGQGKSGSKVFLITPTRQRDALGEYVLKLVPARDRWKLEREVQRHGSATVHLTIGGNIRSHLPALVLPFRSHDPNDPNLKYAVFFGQWFVICYMFLGGTTLGKVLDLETALIEETKRLGKKMENTRFFRTASGGATAPDPITRTRVIETQLDCLCELWYQKPTLANRVNKPLWSYKDRDPEDYPSLPPYQLTGKNKGNILSFLDSQAAEMGVDFFADWDKHIVEVRMFLERNATRSSSDRLLRRDSLVVVCPTHGDLNCNNLLLWLEQVDHPLLIDFPMYQETGHALQDFAKLESEIKFTVMDRQRGNPLNRPRALDYTHTQLALWVEMENLLLSPAWATPTTKLSESGHPENVLFCLSLVQLVRGRAERVQQQTLKGPPASLSFLDEYYPSLLFHTLRAIGYETLSVFKRLLAIYSAARLIHHLS